MVFQPSIPLDGYVGWKFLQNTRARQEETFNQSPEIKRDIEYFEANIANATSAEALVEDRRLLKVALGAFGLGDEIDKRAYVRKILQEGTEVLTSFANRLNNDQFKDFANNFSYGNSSGFSPSTDFIQDIVTKYQQNSFEVAVGDVNANMRLSLNFERQVPEIAGEAANETTLWFKVLGNIPLRTVFESAFGLPSEFSQLDVDRQVDVLSSKARELFRTDDPLEALQDADNIERVIQRFQAREQIEAGPSALTPGFAGLQVLQTSIGASAALNLLLSNS